jgi:hypothetical protein
MVYTTYMLATKENIHELVEGDCAIAKNVHVTCQLL